MNLFRKSKQLVPFLLFTCIAGQAKAQAVAGKIAAIYGWLKPVVSAILNIITLLFAARILFKIAFQQREATADIAWFVVFLVFWGIWAIFASDILSFLGIGVTF